MMHRFYVPDSFDADTVDLTGDEAAHMLRVLRLPVGERVTLFDGRGHAAVAEIVDVKKRSAQLRICRRLAADPNTRPEMTLVTAVPKSDRFRWLIEKATELGVRRLIPIQTERSVVHPGTGKLKKMEAASIASCKQCGRNDLLRIDPVQTWSEVLHSIASCPLLVADPNGQALQKSVLQAAQEPALVLAVGPEGGFTATELALAEANGGVIVRLGPTILRIETAALALVAWLKLNSLGIAPDDCPPRECDSSLDSQRSDN